MTRASKFNPEVAKRAVLLAREGHFRSTIADALGIGRRTLYEWIERGEAEDAEDTDPALAAWVLELRAAEAAVEMQGVLEVRTSTDAQSQRGTAWWLERRWPHKFGRRLQTILSGPDDGPIQMQHQVTGVVEMPAFGSTSGGKPDP